MSDVFKQATHKENGQESLNFFRPVRFPTALGGRGKTLRDGFFGETQTDGSLKRHSTAQGARKPRA